MTDLEILHEMTKADDKRIRSSTTVTGVDTVKAGCIVKMGIDKASGQDLMQGIVFGKPTHLAVMYVVDREEFFKLKNMPDPAPLPDYRALLVSLLRCKGQSSKLSGQEYAMIEFLKLEADASK